MCMSVYLPRSADRPTISVVGSAPAATSACPNGAGAVFWPGSAMLAIIAELLVRWWCCGGHGVLPAGLAARSWSGRSHSCSSMRMKCAFSRVSRNGTPRPIRVSQG